MNEYLFIGLLVLGVIIFLILIMVPWAKLRQKALVSEYGPAIKVLSLGEKIFYLAVAVILVGGLAYIVFQSVVLAPTIDQPGRQVAVVDKKAGWITYQNPELRFGLSHPVLLRPEIKISRGDTGYEVSGSFFVPSTRIRGLSPDFTAGRDDFPYYKYDSTTCGGEVDCWANSIKSFYVMEKFDAGLGSSFFKKVYLLRLPANSYGIKDAEVNINLFELISTCGVSGEMIGRENKDAVSFEAYQRKIIQGLKDNAVSICLGDAVHMVDDILATFVAAGATKR